METQLAFDSKAKQLNLAFKERFVTDSNFQLKISGNVNTQTGRSLKPHVCTGHTTGTTDQVLPSLPWCSLNNSMAAGSLCYQGFLGKFFLAKPRSSSGYALAADKKQLRLGAGKQRIVPATWGCRIHRYFISSAERAATFTPCESSIEMLVGWLWQRNKREGVCRRPL